MDIDTKRKARKILKKGGDLANTLVHLTATTTTLGRVGAVLGAASVLLGDAPDMASRYDRHEVLDMPSQLHRAVIRVLLEGARLRPGDSDGKQRVYTLPAGDGEIVWVYESGEVKTRGPWIVGVDQAQASEALGRAVWEVLGSRVQMEIRRWGEDVELLTDDLTSSLPSGLSRDLAAEMAKYVDAKVSRAVLLHGPSRTGKSYIVRDVAEAIGSFSLRFSSAGWGGASILVAAVRLLRPKSLIMDDLCRMSTTTMLDAMERVRAIVPVVFATANYTDKMDPAILGPGRFDRHILVDEIDSETFAAMTAGLGEDIRSRLREAPVGYLSEFLTEMRVEGEEVAVARLDELLERARMVREAPAPETAGGAKDAG